MPNPRLRAYDKNLDVDLKIELAKQGQDPRNYDNLKGGAYVPGDVYSGLDQGSRDGVSPRGPVDRPLNKVLALKLL